MSTIPRRLLDDLSDDLDALSGAGRQMVLNFLANAEWSDVSELRVLATEAMEGICSSLGDVSTARTAQFYDDVRAASVGAASRQAAIRADSASCSQVVASSTTTKKRLAKTVTTTRIVTVASYLDSGMLRL